MIKCQNRLFYKPLFRALVASCLALCVISLGGCGLNPLTEPKPAYLEVTVKYGPPEFQMAYEDGCKSALSAYGNTMMKTAYHLRKRPEYQYNNMYNQVWRDAWNYCYMSYFLFNRKDILYGENMF